MPFDDLPPEIIQYVFSLCCPTVEFRIPLEPRRSRKGTTQETLSLVCSRWREIALNTRALWGDVAVIYYAAPIERAYEPTASLQLVKIWLNRARMAPISLSISVLGARKSELAAISQTLLSSFDVTNPDLKSCHSFLLVPTNNSSRLERLHLYFPEPARISDTFPRFPEMPSLKDLHLCMHPRDFFDITNLYLIPWHQLRVLDFIDIHWPSQVLLNVLQRCKPLVKCTLSTKPEPGQHEHDIVLPNLECLVLSMKLGSSANSIIRSLTVPSLRSLDIKSWSGYTELPLSTEAIVIMAQRSGFNKHLTNFSLCLTQQPVDVRSLLGSMPALKSVTLHGLLMFQPGTFGDLSSGTIGPQLEELRFGSMSDEEVGLLLETVGRRHEKAKTVSDIRPFASVISRCTSRCDFESHEQRAKQCSEAFNADVVIVPPRGFHMSLSLG